MLSIKLLDDYLIKSQDIKTFKIQLLRDAVPYALTSGCTCTLLIANKDSIVVEEEMTIIDASQGIVEFTLHATIGTGNFDCEFLVSNGNDIHLTFPDSGYTVLKISDCLSERPIQVITPSEYVKLNERMDGFIGELDEFEQSVTTTIDGFEVTLGTMQTQINNSINTMNSNFATLKNGIEEQMVEMEELVGTVVDPMQLTLVNDNNSFSVGVDNTGTKYNAIESSESTIELNGRTLVNLLNHRYKEFTGSNEDSVGRVCINPFKWDLTVGQTYTVFVNVTSLIVGDSPLKIQTRSKNDKYHSVSLDVKLGYNKFAFKIQDEGVNELLIYADNLSTNVNYTYYSFKDILVLEGDYTNVPIEYFEGLQSSNPTEVKSVGKNVLDTHFLQFNDSNYTHIWKCKDSPETKKVIEFFIKNRGKTFIYNCDITGEKQEDGIRIGSFRIYHQSKAVLLSFPNVPFVPSVVDMDFEPNDNSYVIIYGSNKGASCKNFIFTLGTEVGGYEPYKENIVTLPNIEPLRSLPNGVCDEAFIHDDKLIVTRKIGQFQIIDGSNFTDNANYTTDTIKAMLLTDNVLLKEIPQTSFEQPNNALSDCLRQYHNSDLPNCFRFSSNKYLHIFLDKTIYADTETAQKWITDNKPTFTYQKLTPTYEWYELPSPHLYKNGHVFIDSGSVPLISNCHNIDLSLRSAIDTNVEEIVQIKNELNELDMTIATDVTELVNLIKDGE